MQSLSMMTSMELIGEAGRKLLVAMVASPEDKELIQRAIDYFVSLGECNTFVSHLRYGRPGPPSLNGIDWEEAFKYAKGEIKRAHPYREICTDPFDRGMIRHIHAMKEGRNDEEDWLCVGRLWDGRWFSLDAGCDYTGWG